MITVEQLHRNYGTIKAVNNVSFSIQTGEVIGLLGPNGAGKTTIMKMLCGFLEPSSGQVKIHGRDMRTDTKAAQALVGYLPENLPVYPDMTVTGYLEYAAGLRGIAKEQQGEQICRVIQATDLHAKAFAKIAHLSRGLKQRVGVAQALLGEPKVLVLDEPSNGLDPTQTEQMRKLIRNLAQTSTVILSTHILSEVEAVCDRVLMVRSGELVLDSRLNDLKDSAVINLQTSLAPALVEQLLAAVAGIKSVAAAASGDLCNVRIDCSSAEQAQSVAAAAAREILHAGGDLYQLQREQRNLEVLFRELNGQLGVRHAA